MIALILMDPCHDAARYEYSSVTPSVKASESGLKNQYESNASLACFLERIAFVDITKIACGVVCCDAHGSFDILCNEPHVMAGSSISEAESQPPPLKEIPRIWQARSWLSTNMASYPRRKRQSRYLTHHHHSTNVIVFDCASSFASSARTSCLSHTLVLPCKNQHGKYSD